MTTSGRFVSAAVIFAVATAGFAVRADDVDDAVDGKGKDKAKKHGKFDKIDTNHDGSISREEWEAWRAEHKHHHHKKEAAAATAPAQETTTPAAPAK